MRIILGMVETAEGVKNVKDLRQKSHMWRSSPMGS